MPDLNIPRGVLEAAARRANQEHRSLSEVVTALLRCYAEGQTWANLPAGENAAPSPAQIRAWLAAHGWTLRSTGTAGTAWDPPNGWAPVAVPDTGRDAALIAGVIARVAHREGRDVPGVRGEMLAAEAREDGDRG